MYICRTLLVHNLNTKNDYFLKRRKQLKVEQTPIYVNWCVKETSLTSGKAERKISPDSSQTGARHTRVRSIIKRKMKRNISEMAITAFTEKVKLKESTAVKISTCNGYISVDAEIV